MISPPLPYHRLRLGHPTISTALAITLVWACGSRSAVSADTDTPAANTINYGPYWSLCESNLWVAPPHPAISTEGSDPASTYLLADESSLSDGNIITLEGNVQIRRENKYLTANRIRYDKSSETVDIQGDIEFWDEGYYLLGDKAHMDLESDESRIESGSFLLLESHAHGTGSRIQLQGSNRMKAKNATYTTCSPKDGRFGARPGEEDSESRGWWLTARKIRTDKIKDSGIAHDVTVKLKDVPIFYTPYLSFPLSDKRKTGFLTPSFGLSGGNGTDITAPFYWNIAPEQDATFAVRGMMDRGVLLQGEYRYLSRFGNGQVGLEILPNDKSRNESRSAFRFEHKGNLAPRWHTDINFNYISDKNYFEDMGTSLDISSTRFQERRADISYGGDQWHALGRFQDYQVIDETILPVNRPYEQLPQLKFSTYFPERNRTLNFNLQGEGVNFQRRSSITGTRFDIMPSVTFPLRTASTSLIPKLSLRHTQYNLSGTTAGAPDTPKRTLPIFSIDGKLFLERTMRLGKRTYTQSLEPRLFYLYVPYKNQDDFPIFDSSEYTFNFGNLFRDHRFSGADRVGDAHQVSLALTTRVLNETGREALSAGVGQIRHLRNRKVNLTKGTTDTDGSSDIIAAISANVARQWRIRSGLQYDVQENTAKKTSFSLRYKPDEERVFNLGYRYDQAHEEQANTSFRWGLGKNWGAIGRWTYGIPESQTVEAVAGVEYDSCCWGARALVQRYLSSADGEFSNAFFIQLELKGLAGIGRKTGRFLTRSIPGYQNKF
uniref:LPS-assembly protein LptD n=1 Tax=Candidatus Kentrum sp. TC TaxID=2126339 RepID=A0A450YB40_9GAMM|nr:MAG: LPS-assembly protein [Candidatus Kentron sp. TC]VFK53238.1 MAG: LPS-assembly protein [Candidatus Kentron sp. TC]